jgi:hypothetical protein
LPPIRERRRRNEKRGRCLPGDVLLLVLRKCGDEGRKGYEIKFALPRLFLPRTVVTGLGGDVSSKTNEDE